MFQQLRGRRETETRFCGSEVNSKISKCGQHKLPHLLKNLLVNKIMKEGPDIRTPVETLSQVCISKEFCLNPQVFFTGETRKGFYEILTGSWLILSPLYCPLDTQPVKEADPREKGIGTSSLVITVPEKLGSSTNTISHVQLIDHQKDTNLYMQLPAPTYKAEQISSTPQGWPE